MVKWTTILCVCVFPQKGVVGGLPFHKLGNKFSWPKFKRGSWYRTDRVGRLGEYRKCCTGLALPCSRTPKWSVHDSRGKALA